jgi:hypothetical protein
MRVERNGWFIDIEPLDVSRRPNWEIRCLIRRKRENQVEERKHRFIVSGELSERFRLDGLPDSRREERLLKAAKRVILKDFDEIFSEPAGGLDSVRFLEEPDFRE